MADSNKEIQNPQAFPLIHNGAEYEPKRNDGMTLRDYFAAKALTPLGAAYGYGGKNNAEYHANYAYEIADAMLKQRIK